MLELPCCFIKLKRQFFYHINIKYHVIYLSCPYPCIQNKRSILCSSSMSRQKLSGKINKCIKQQHNCNFISVAIFNQNVICKKVMFGRNIKAIALFFSDFLYFCDFG